MRATRKLIGAIALMGAFAWAMGQAHAARTVRTDCNLYRVGVRVVLYGTSDDPNVFVWDSRERVLKYAYAKFRNVEGLLTHAVLAAPGTRAKVTSCVRVAQLNPPFHVISIVITSGPLRGEIGWLRSTDIAVMHALRQNRRRHL